LVLAVPVEEQLQSQVASKEEVQFFQQSHLPVAVVVMNVAVLVDQEVQVVAQED
jgi:hypothetical protein